MWQFSRSKYHYYYDDKIFKNLIAATLCIPLASSPKWTALKNQHTHAPTSIYTWSVTAVALFFHYSNPKTVFVCVFVLWLRCVAEEPASSKRNLRANTCCDDSDDIKSAMMSDQKDELNFENNYKSCFARSVVVNSQFSKHSKSEELFLGDLLEPLKMTTENDAVRNDESVSIGQETILRDLQFQARSRKTASNKMVGIKWNYRTLKEKCCSKKNVWLIQSL